MVNGVTYMVNSVNTCMVNSVNTCMVNSVNTCMVNCKWCNDKWGNSVNGLPVWWKCIGNVEHFKHCANLICTNNTHCRATCIVKVIRWAYDLMKQNYFFSSFYFIFYI